MLFKPVEFETPTLRYSGDEKNILKTELFDYEMLFKLEEFENVGLRFSVTGKTF